MPVVFGKKLTMNGLFALTLVALAHFAASAAVGSEDLLEQKCAPKDDACIKSGFQSFLKKTASGYPQYNIVPYDPLEIELIKVDVDNLSSEFKNVKITGFKDQEVTFLEEKGNTDTFVTKANIEITADSYLKGEKEYNGAYKIKATVSGTVSYPKEDKKKEDGKEYIIVGDETISCKIEGTPEVNVAENLIKALETDPVLGAHKKKFDENREAVREQVLCTFVKEAYKAISGNLRKFLGAVSKDELYKQ